VDDLLGDLMGLSEIDSTADQDLDEIMRNFSSTFSPEMTRPTPTGKQAPTGELTLQNGYKSTPLSEMVKPWLSG